jgi:hypothetical protein
MQLCSPAKHSIKRTAMQCHRNIAIQKKMNTAELEIRECSYCLYPPFFSATNIGFEKNKVVLYCHVSGANVTNNNGL